MSSSVGERKQMQQDLLLAIFSYMVFLRFPRSDRLPIMVLPAIQAPRWTDFNP